MFIHLASLSASFLAPLSFSLSQWVGGWIDWFPWRCVGWRPSVYCVVKFIKMYSLDIRQFVRIGSFNKVHNNTGKEQKYWCNHELCKFNFVPDKDVRESAVLKQKLRPDACNLVLGLNVTTVHWWLTLVKVYDDILLLQFNLPSIVFNQIHVLSKKSKCLRSWAGQTVSMEGNGQITF